MTSTEPDNSIKPSLGHLTKEQEVILFQFWDMLFKFFDNQRAAYDINSNPMVKFFSQVSLSLDFEESDTNIKAILSSSKCREIIDILKEELWYQISADDPDVLLIRFLRSRKWDLNEAFLNLIKCLKWRNKYGVQQLIAEGEAALHKESIKSGKLLLFERDLAGRTVLFLRVRYHDKCSLVPNDTLKHLVYITEIGRRCGSEQATIVFDLIDAGIGSLDLGLAKLVISTFQENYPEGLGKWIILGAPWFFKSFWSLMKKIMDPEVCDKVVFVNNYIELQKFIPLTSLPIEYGGSRQINKLLLGTIESYEENSQEPIIKLSEEESTVLVRDKSLLLDQFEKLTNEILYSVGEGFGLSDPILEAMMVHRAYIKKDIQRVIRKIEMATIKPSVFHKLKIINLDGTANWL